MDVATLNSSLALSMDDMDMDIDIDLGPMEGYPEANQSEYPLQTSTEAPKPEDAVMQQDLQLTSEQPVPHKIHIRGLDDFTTNDIKAFSIQHLPAHPPSHIEWIDDTSANLVYETPGIALEALNHFSIDSNGDVAFIHALQLRRAKPSLNHPASNIQVRTAISTDQKRPRAYEASRFYMLHPEHDPRERKRRERGRSGNRRRLDGTKDKRRRDRKDDKEKFSASMYDDNEDALAERGNGKLNTRSVRSSISSATGSEAFQGDSYRPTRPNRRRSRDRSASPGRSSDDDLIQSRKSKRRTPPPRYRSSDPHPFPRENTGKELFPSKPTSRDVVGELRGRSSVSVSKDLFPQKLSTSDVKELFPSKRATVNTKKELFPLKSGASVHRRSDAFDAADETADVFAAGMTVPFVDGTMDSTSIQGRLRPTDPDPDPETLADLQHGGFSIRGAAQSKGFSIRGTANEAKSVVGARELFPHKAGNAGKELFAERLQGRGGRRNKAEDMFY